LYQLPTEKKRGRTWDRSLYVWSKSFNEYSDPEILAFLHTKGIKNVLFSLSKNTDKQKMDVFLEGAKQANINVEMMLGANEWVFPENHERAAATSLLTSEKYGAIHFDIEPHTFDDFKERKSYYLDNYIAMLTAVRIKNPTQALSVAVPLHWPEEYYQKTSDLVDGIYIMAYGSNKPETLVRRLRPKIRQLGNDKVTVVLRLKDFANEWELEQMIDKLNQGLGIKRFAFENLTNFLALTSQQ